MNLVRYVGEDGCDAEEYRSSLVDDTVNVIDTSRVKGNVSVHFRVDGRLATTPFPTMIRDVFDLGILVYIADELLDREAGFDGWTRDFAFTLPVKDVRRWTKHSAHLAKLLGHLTGDLFEFSWMQRDSLVGYGSHDLRIPKGFDVLCLFSGGVDSLLGAYNLLSSGKRVLLCGHYADGITSSAQMRLFGDLRNQFGDSVSLVQCHVARSRRPKVQYPIAEKREDSHRPRSFLFLTTAVAVAKLAEIEEIYVPENGLIALNAPLGISRVGTLSTRTVHPRFISDFRTWVAGLGAFEGSISNQFYLHSKTDMVVEADERALDLLRKSISCAHVGRIRWTGRKGIHHCGYCVPCLYRRAAFIERGIDDPSDYYADVMADLSTCSEVEQSDFRFLVRFAENVGRMKSLQVGTMALAQGAFSASEIAESTQQPVGSISVLGDMITRWAATFRNAVKQNASNATKRIVGLR